MPPPRPPLDRLPDLAQAVSARRAAFLAALADLPVPQRAQPPKPEAWSPLAIGEHLMLVERGLGIITERQLAKGEARRDVGTPDPKRVEGLLTALRTPAPFRVPSGSEAVVPTGELDLDALRARWAEAAERWERIVAAFPPALAEVALVHHPIAGALTAEQTLAFLEAHVVHHEHQLARTVRALNGGLA